MLRECRCQKLCFLCRCEECVRWVLHCGGCDASAIEFSLCEKYHEKRNSLGRPTAVVPPELRARRAIGGDQIFGRTMPVCDWYFPFLSLYEISQDSSDSKKTTWQRPSLA